MSETSFRWDGKDDAFSNFRSNYWILFNVGLSSNNGVVWLFEFTDVCSTSPGKRKTYDFVFYRSDEVFVLLIRKKNVRFVPLVFVDSSSVNTSWSNDKSIVM